MIYLVVYLWVVGGVSFDRAVNDCEKDKTTVDATIIIIWPVVFAVALIWHFAEWVLRKLKRGN